jgi:hypothetical protein
MKPCSKRAQRFQHVFELRWFFIGPPHCTHDIPLHCIIIVAPPACPFVMPAFCCLLHCLCCWHLCHVSLFRLIVVFTPPCCLLPSSPKRAFVTICLIANVSCPPPHSSYPPSRPFVVLAGCCPTRYLCCWHLCSCCAHANAPIALASLPSLHWHLCNRCRQHCHRPLLPLNASSPRIPLLADYCVCQALPWWCGR